MVTFTDYYHNQVSLSFADHPFSKTPRHVWVICKFKDKWLLTGHKRRGIEFPGGKVEQGELPETAARREVLEETGAFVEQLTYIGQYQVFGKGGTITKNIYFALIDRMEPQTTYFETNGPVLLTELPSDVRKHAQFSFIMKDEVLPYSLKQIEEIMSSQNSVG